MAGTRTMENDEMLDVVAAVAREHGAEGWLVGGSVRDRQLGHFSPDIDVVVTGDAEAVARRIARLLDVPWFTLSAEHRAYRVVGGRAHVDIAAVRGGGILADLAERDFTINAMAQSIDGAEIIDPFGGLEDLRAGRLRAVSDHIFQDDPLRLMRAARFSNTLPVALEPPLVRMINGSASLLWRAAPERIASELLLTLEGRSVLSAAGQWNALGLLPHLFPEVSGRGGPDWSALQRLEELISLDPSSPYFFGPDSLLRERMSQPADGAVDRGTALKLAGVLWGVAPAEAQQAGRRLKLSNALLSLLETTARMSRWEHDGLVCAPDSGLRMLDGRFAHRDAAPGRAAVLFLWDALPWEPEVILLAAAASRLCREVTVGDRSSLSEAELTTPGFEVARRLMAQWVKRERGGVPRLPFDGNGLMRELDLEPGPRLGKALRAARLAWEAGEAETADMALAAARAAMDEG